MIGEPLNVTEQEQTLSRGNDHLGFIEATLRDLAGYSTLANELIQNADDATDADEMSFDIRNDALVVENNGVFRDCLQQELPECPWFVDPAVDVRCDFHSFRKVASRDKRNREGTTGAFGIGFIAVYQVTDRPQVISAGRHWTIRDELPEDQRILVCPGCPEDGVTGTRFVLPWARDPGSALRRAIRGPVITDASIDQIEQEIGLALPTGILFLRKLRSIDLRREGTALHQIERLTDHDRVLVSDGDELQEWVLLTGDFSADAARIRGAAPEGRIEPKRSSTVTIAVPRGGEVSGVVAQGLPTQQVTGFPFHINADFFTSSDRKKIVLEADFQSDWNRAAVRGAASALASSLLRLRDVLGPTDLWKLIAAVQAAATPSRPQDPVFAAFWEAVLAVLPTSEVAFGTDEQWHRPSQVFRSVQVAEAEAKEELAALGITLLREDLRSYTFSMPGPAGFRNLTASDVAGSLRAAGLEGVVETEAIPELLRPPEAVARLLAAVDELLEPKRVSADGKAAIASSAIAPCRGGALGAPDSVFIADDATAGMFSAIGDVQFVGPQALEAYPRVRELTRAFGVADAIEVLEGVAAVALRDSYSAGAFSPKAVLGWFAGRTAELETDTDLKARLAALPIYPAGAGLAPLSELVMVGNFEDPLELTEFVDLSALPGLRGFLETVGVDTLDLKTYLRRLPAQVDAFGDALGDEQRRLILRLLADRLGEFRDDEGIREGLRRLPLASTEHGWIHPDAAYFASEDVANALGATASIVQIGVDHHDADRAAFAWLGTRESPRASDILSRVRALTEMPATPASRAGVLRVLAWVGKQPEPTWTELAALRTMAWLPSNKSTQWRAPAEVYARFSASLFASQAEFLDSSMPAQTSIADYLRWLGVESQPSVTQVAEHLMELVSADHVVGREIYLFLENHADDAGIDILAGERCLVFGGRALRADEVFWNEHGLEPYAFRLPPEVREYAKLLRRLGVKDDPDAEDALRVLEELSDAVGHNPLSPDQRSLAMACWRILERELARGAVDPDDLAGRGDRPSIPNSVPILERPDWLYFDDRPGLAAKFGKVLASVVIERPPDAWRCMREAGVRDLSRVVEERVLELVDPRANLVVDGRVGERRHLLRRVIEAHARTTDEFDRTLLGELPLLQVSALELQYSISLAGGLRHAETSPESPSAHYLAANRALYFVADDGDIPWTAIARELAAALFPRLEPAGPASGFRDVLIAASADQAAATLDELHYPTLADDLDDSATPVVQLGSLGEETDEEEGTEAAWGEGRGASGSSAESEGASGGTRQPEGSGGSSSETSSAPGPGGEAPPGEPGAGSTGDAPAAAPSAKRHKQSRLRSYVVIGGESTGTDDKGDDDVGEAEHRTTIELAGIERVRAAEIDAGRTPEVMPPFNPGFDVRSVSAIGDEILIEVKSTSETWGAQGVGLSRRQFRTALEAGEQFWLYVVERADQPDFRIIRIQNPANRVNQFMFDDGWRGADDQRDWIVRGAAPDAAADVEDGLETEAADGS